MQGYGGGPIGGQQYGNSGIPPLNPGYQSSGQLGGLPGGGIQPNIPGGGLAPTLGYQQMPPNNLNAATSGAMQENNNYHFRFKIALVGDSGVGKSTFLDAISQTLGSVIENEESSELHIKVS